VDLARQERLPRCEQPPRIALVKAAAKRAASKRAASKRASGRRRS
jgi:hypothetical protein